MTPIISAGVEAVKIPSGIYFYIPFHRSALVSRTIDVVLAPRIGPAAVLILDVDLNGLDACRKFATLAHAAQGSLGKVQFFSSFSDLHFVSPSANPAPFYSACALMDPVGIEPT